MCARPWSQPTPDPCPKALVGAGTGMQMFDFKGGIGTASRIVEIGFAQLHDRGAAEHQLRGTRQQLQIAGRPLGRHLTAKMPVHHKRGRASLW